jgi:hypothetical protein
MMILNPSGNLKGVPQTQRITKDMMLDIRIEPSFMLMTGSFEVFLCSFQHWMQKNIAVAFTGGNNGNKWNHSC